MEDIKIEMKKDLDNMNDAPPLKQKKKNVLQLLRMSFSNRNNKYR